MARAAGLSGEDLLYSALQGVSPTAWLPRCSQQPCSFSNVFPPDLTYTPSTWVQLVNGGLAPCTAQTPVTATCMEIRDSLQSDADSPPGVSLYEIVGTVDVRTNCRTGSWDQSVGQPTAGNCVYARALERFAPRQYTNYLNFTSSELLDPALVASGGISYSTWNSLCTQLVGGTYQPLLDNTGTPGGSSGVLGNPSVCQVPSYLGATPAYPGDSLNGTVATNDATVYSCGNGSAQPSFVGIQATSSTPSAEYPSATYTGSNGSSTCSGTAPHGTQVAASPLPQTVSSLGCVAAIGDSLPPTSTGYCGVAMGSGSSSTLVSITLSGSGPTSSTYSYSYSTNGGQTWSSVVTQPGWPSNSVIFVDGTVLVQGETCLPLTIGSAGSIVITGNLYYNPECSRAVLGLVASNAVTVQPTVVNNQIQCWPNPVNGQCMTIQAAVMALGVGDTPSPSGQPAGGSFSLTGWNLYAPPNGLSSGSLPNYDTTISQYSPTDNWSLTDTCSMSAVDQGGDNASVNGLVLEGQSPGPIANNPTSPPNTAMTFTGLSGGSSPSVAGGTGFAGAVIGSATGGAGYVYTWGTNTSGQLGNGTTTSTTSPVPVSGVGGKGCLSGITAIAAGTSYMLALTSSGNVYAWGSNASGQLGNNSTTSSTTPVEVLGVGGSGYLGQSSPVVAIAANGSTSYALTQAGNVYAWGAGSSGQLGNKTTTTSQTTPVEVAASSGSGYLSSVTAIAAGATDGYALSGGNVYAFGAGSSGQLGNGSTTTTQSTPVQVKGVNGSGTLSSIKAIAAGASDAGAITSSGGVDMWGAGSSGQLGNGSTTTTQSTPVQVKGVNGSGTLANAVALSIGSAFTVALTGSASPYSAFAWGADASGQLGNNSITTSTTPVQVLGVGGTGTLSTSSTSIDAGATFVIAGASIGTLLGWGDNSTGQLAAASPTTMLTPVAVGPLPLGAASYLSTTTPMYVGGAVSLTLNAWVKTSSPGPIISFDNPSAQAGGVDYLQLWVGSDHLVHFGTNVNGVSALSVTAPKSGTLSNSWHMVTVTISSTGACLYLDGQQSGCGTLPTLPTATQGFWWIAGAENETGWPAAPATSSGIAALSGSEGRVAVLPGVLSAQQVATLYNASQVSQSQCPTTANANVCALVFSGSITEAYQGAFGSYLPTSNGPAIATGIAKNFTYDQNLAYHEPPYFLQPVSGAWQRQGAVFTGGLGP